MLWWSAFLPLFFFFFFNRRAVFGKTMYEISGKSVLETWVFGKLSENSDWVSYKFINRFQSENQKKTKQTNKNKNKQTRPQARSPWTWNIRVLTWPFFLFFKKPWNFKTIQIIWYTNNITYFNTHSHALANIVNPVLQ